MPVNIGRHSLLRDLNHSAVLEALARAGDRSRVELATELTLSQASVSRIVERLLEGGLVRELAARQIGHGRPQVPLEVSPNAAHVATVDLRRDCYRLRLTDLCGRRLAEVRAPATGGESLPRAVTASDAVELVFDLLEAARQLAEVSSPFAAFVVGVSAAWDERSGRIYAARNVPYLEGVDLRSLVSERLDGEVEVQVANDVKLAAVGELDAGAAKERSDFYYLSLGSGVAGAGVIAGKVQEGRTGFAGEVGYLRVRAPDGGWTDLETLVGRAALEARWKRSGNGEPLLAALARPPADRAERELRRELIDNIVMALTAIAAVMDVPYIVLGGSLGVGLAPLLRELEAALAETVPPPPTLAASGLGADGALIGGIRIAQEAARASLLKELLG